MVRWRTIALTEILTSKDLEMQASNSQANTNAHPDLSVLSGGISIVTGGASGIGLALVQRSIEQGMHCVMADIDKRALEQALSPTASIAESHGVEVIGVQTDVSSPESIGELYDATMKKFAGKPISLLCCNAGVGAGGGVLSARDVDWEFVLGVNLMGVVYCLRKFVPHMLDQDAPASVMATSSQDGICAAQGVYGVSKHACVALMEAVHNEVRGRISVHVLCPNAVATNIVNSERHRPIRYGGTEQDSAAEVDQPVSKVLERFKQYGMPPARCAEFVFKAIESGVFYVLAEAEDDEGYVRLEAETRMNAILNGTRPYRPQSALLRKIFAG